MQPKLSILCGQQQDVPLQWHHDSALDLELDETADRGNFWAFLQFRAAAGDLVLRIRLLEMLCTCLLMFRIKLTFLVIMFNERFLFSSKDITIIHEVTDCSNKEQLSHVLWFVDRTVRF